MEELETIQEQSLRILSATGGKELDLSCNLASPRQIEIIIESDAHGYLGSRYTIDKMEHLLRLTNSYGARHRSDVVEIAKAPLISGWGGSSGS